MLLVFTDALKQCDVSILYCVKIAYRFSFRLFQGTATHISGMAYFGFLVLLTNKIYTSCKFNLVSDCSSAAVGVADSSTIRNYRFTASSTYFSSFYEPWYARLQGSYGWTPSTKTNVPNEWLQIDLGSSYFICAVATQGHGRYNEWIRNYKLRLLNNNNDWQNYKESGTERVNILVTLCQ